MWDTASLALKRAAGPTDLFGCARSNTEVAQGHASPVKLGRLLGKAKTKDVLPPPATIEGGTSHCPHARRAKQVPRLDAGPVPFNPGCIRQHVISSRGHGRGESGRRQGVADLVPLLLIFGRQPVVEAIGQGAKSGRRGVLKWRWSAHILQIVEVPDGGDPLAARAKVAHPPSSHAEGFGEPGDGDGPLRHAWDGCRAHMRLPVIDEVLIDFICQYEEVVFNRQRSN